MNGRPLQLALREMQAIFTSPAQLAGVAVAIGVLTVSGPWGTFTELDVWHRFFYWAAVVLLTYTVGQGTVTFAIETLRPWITQKWPRVVVSAIVGAIPTSLILTAINAVAYGRFEPGGMFKLWINVTVVTLAIATVMVLATDRMRAAAEAQMPLPAKPDAGPPILDRVPAPQRGRLLALSVEDHYVDIITERGKTLVLMRLADAIRETGNVDGVQIHRSHWVARDAVKRSLRTDGRLLVELSDGRQLPVSRGFAPAAKAAGII